MRTVPCTTAVFLGLSALGAAMIADQSTWQTDELVFGAVLMLAAGIFWATGRVVAAITSTNREADAAFEAGFEMGMDKGYLDGRKAKLSPVAPFENRRAVAHLSLK